MSDVSSLRMKMLSRDETSPQCKLKARVPNLCRSLELACLPVPLLIDTMLIARTDYHDSMSLLEQSLTFTFRDILEYRSIFDFVVTISLNFSSKSVE